MTDSPEIVFKGIPIKTDSWPAGNEKEKEKDNIFYMINARCMNPKHPLYRVLQYFLNYYKERND